MSKAIKVIKRIALVIVGIILLVPGSFIIIGWLIAKLIGGE